MLKKIIKKIEEAAAKKMYVCSLFIFLNNENQFSEKRDENSIQFEFKKSNFVEKYSMTLLNTSNLHSWIDPYFMIDLSDEKKAINKILERVKIFRTKSGGSLNFMNEEIHYNLELSNYEIYCFVEPTKAIKIMNALKCFTYFNYDFQTKKLKFYIYSLDLKQIFISCEQKKAIEFISTKEDRSLFIEKNKNKELWYIYGNIFTHKYIDVKPILVKENSCIIKYDVNIHTEFRSSNINYLLHKGLICVEVPLSIYKDEGIHPYKTQSRFSRDNSFLKPSYDL